MNIWMQLGIGIACGLLFVLFLVRFTPWVFYGLVDWLNRQPESEPATQDPWWDG